MPELATVQTGQADSNLPPINLPTIEAPQQRLRISVGLQPPPGKDGDLWSAFPDKPPTQAKTQETDHWSAFPDKPPDKPAQSPVGTGEAAMKGVRSGLTFGAAPAIAGLAEAGGERNPIMEAVGHLAAGPFSPAFKAAGIDPVRTVTGGLKLLHEAFSSHPDQEVKAAYERGREAALKKERAAQEQHPYAFFAGQMAGGMAVPVGGAAMQAATLPARIGRGAATGAVGGGLFGAGEATSEGKGLPEVAKSGVMGAAIGAPLGGAISGAIGPRLVNAASSGQRAAATAADLLQTPLGRGLASDNRGLQAITAKMRAVPMVGTRISSNVRDVETAAGGHLGAIAEHMAGGPPSRSIADTLVRPGFQHVIDVNRRTIDAGYNSLRSQIDTAQHYTLPRTDAVINRIMRERAAAHWANPAEGLEQFRSAAGGVTFNGAHRARVDARNAGNVISPHPGYNAADFNQITRAMTEDLRQMVQVAANNQTPQGRRAALAAFDHAERQFGPLADQNALLHRLVNAQGEGAISKVLGAAKERSGNLRLLAQLRQSMPPAEFQQIGATLLHEIGHRPSSPDGFSFAQFATEWRKISDGAGRVLFSPQHLDHINQIANLGQHIKGSLRESNTSHTAGVIILFDLARDAILLGVSAGAGTLTVGTGVGAAIGGAGVLFGHWLASPATSASMAAWVRAYRGVAGGAVSTARIASFNAATRNLSHNLGVPADRILQSVQGRIAGPASGIDEEHR